MMKEIVLKQAKAWRFLCQEDSQGNWQILPQQPADRWELQQVEDRWLLLVGDVPQVNLHPHEVISFLERRHSDFKRSSPFRGNFA